MRTVSASVQSSGNGRATHAQVRDTSRGPVTSPSVQDRIEAGFERFGRRVVRARWLAAAGTLALAALLVDQLPPPFETAVEKFLRTDDPARVLWEEFQDQFGRPDAILVSVRPPDVFDLAFLERLRELHDALEDEVPHLEEIQSLINARSTRGEGDELIVEDLLEELPRGPEELRALRERVLSNPFYVNTLISKDGSFTGLLLTLDLYAGEVDDDYGGFEEDEGPEPAAARRELSGFEIHGTVARVRELLARFDAPGFRLRMAGSPVLQERVVASMQRQLPRFVAIMMGAVALLLALLFRRASGVLLPLLTVALSLACTVGAMAAAGAPITPPTQVLPTFLLAVGIGTAVHVLKIFYMRFDAGDSVEDAVAHALGHSGLAIVMTGATTAGGLLSFSVAGLTPIEDLGRFAPLGVLLVLLYSLVLLPALLAIVPLRRRPALPEGALTRRLEAGIVRIGMYSARHPGPVLGTTAVAVVVALFGIARLEFSNDVMSWLPPESELRQATGEIDRELGGSMTLELVVDTGARDGAKQPEILSALDELRVTVGGLTRGDHLYVGRTISIADVVKEIHQALNENRPEYYAVPDDARLVAQELLLFENSGSDDLEDVVDTPFRQARFTIKLPYIDPIGYDGFIEEVEAHFAERLPEATIGTTGFMAMMGQTVKRVIRGMTRSYLLALAIITPLMILLLASLRTGLASMVPNLSPIVLVLGLMGFSGVRIDSFTMMIGSIAIGLVVDDTIHFMHGFRRYYAKCGDPYEAVTRTLETTGQALLFTSIVLSLGFSVFALSDMVHLAYFGIFTAIAIAGAFLLDIAVSPALMILATRRDFRQTAEPS